METMKVDDGGGREKRVRVDYPSNSKKAQAEGEEKPKVEKVVEGTVVQRKKGLGAKFREAFMVEDSGSVLVYIVQEVLVPAAKNTILEVFSQGLERSLYGETRRQSQTRPGGYTAYHRAREPYSAGGRELSRQARATHDFRDVILTTRGDAEEVIDSLKELADRYNCASVQDLYDLVGVTGEYTDNKWGWYAEDFRRAGVRPVRGGYLLELPRPVSIGSWS
jgi:hypothetical protein